MIATSSSIVSRPSSSVTRSCASAAQAQASIGGRLAAGLRGQLRGGQPTGAAGAKAREQSELDAEVHQPRAVEPAQAGDQVVESVVKRHPGRIVAWRASPAARAGYRNGTDGIGCNGR